MTTVDAGPTEPSTVSAAVRPARGLGEKLAARPGLPGPKFGRCEGGDVAAGVRRGGSRLPRAPSRGPGSGWSPEGQL